MSLVDKYWWKFKFFFYVMISSLLSSAKISFLLIWKRLGIYCWSYDYASRWQHCMLKA